MAPYFILGQDAHLRVHDNLDSNISWYKVLNDSGQLFAPLNTHIPQIINGHLSRDAYYSQFYGMIVLFSFLPPMVAYGLSQVITRLLAFIGMFLLLRKHVFKSDDHGIISVGVSLVFALTPYWPSGMLSILGMPLALWAFLNIREGERGCKNWIVLTLLPLVSTFVLGFFFFLSTLGIVWLVDMIRKRKWHWRFFLSILYMSLIYLLIEYRAFASLVMPHEATNRSVFYESKLSLIQTLKLILKNYVYGHNQDMTVSAFIILPVSVITLLIVIFQKRLKQEKLFISLHILNLVLSTWYAFWFYEGWQPIKDHVGILTSFNFARYHYLRPMVIYVLFALSLRIIFRLGKNWRPLIFVCLIAQIVVLIPYNEQIAYHKQPTFRQFYAVDQFTKIKNYIGQPLDDFRVVSIGIHPAIAQYNGFYTLDTYNNFYPLTYKYQFREIIAPELDKNKTIKAYFDEWGGRCYIFTDELGKHYMYSKDSDQVIKHLDLNIDALKKMGGRYIISAVPILNAHEEHLTFEKAFKDKHSNWVIYLYKVQ